MINICGIKGIVTQKVDFKFMISKTHDAIAIFRVNLENDSTVTVKAFDEWADYCYSNLEEGCTAVIYGRINSEMEIIAEEVYSENEEPIEIF